MRSANLKTYKPSHSNVQSTSKEDIYQLLLAQLNSLLDDDVDYIANTANFCAAIQQNFHFHWVGLYRVMGEELVLSAFQGPTACTRIPFGRGVCGQAWEEKKTLIVGDVHSHPNHITCSALSQSEIVVPLFDSHGNVKAVLDIDADIVNAFDTLDKDYLEECVALLAKYY